MMSVERYRENLKWWEDREKQYPHHCKTKVGLSPEGVRHRIPGVDFIRVPFVKEAWVGVPERRGPAAVQVALCHARQ
jgi:hypothetical protein